MKYQFKLILRVILAFVLNSTLWYWLLILPTILFPYVLIRIFGFEAGLSLSRFTIYSGNFALEFVEACVASVAYYLLALLILTTKDIEWKKMLKMFVFGGLLIFAMNVFRVTLIIILLLTLGGNWFDLI